MIYFDNAATTFPKPESVVKAVENALKYNSANPGRAGHKMAYETAELVYNTRKLAADFFGTAAEENVIFTPNCTYSINCVIKGLARKGSRFLCSSLEHNAVARPLETLKNRGLISYTVVNSLGSDDETVENFRKELSYDTRAVICTAASNVFGKRLPLKRLSELAHKNGALFCVDAAQAAGIVDINCKRDGIDFLCVAAHKGLYAPMSSGLLIINCGENLETLCEGGTGNLSAVLTQPDSYPERLESGTLSIPNIAGINAGIKFVNSKGIDKIYSHENGIIKYIYSNLLEMKNVILYNDIFSLNESYVPLLSFNIKNLPSEEVAGLLSDADIAVRAGFHCAILAHRTYGTESFGTVRIAPSAFTGSKDVKILLNSVFKIAKSR